MTTRPASERAAESALFPCPKCGGAGEVVDSDLVSHYMARCSVGWPRDVETYSMRPCPVVFESTRKSAADEWNRLAPTDAPTKGP